MDLINLMMTSMDLTAAFAAAAICPTRLFAFPVAGCAEDNVEKLMVQLKKKDKELEEIKMQLKENKEDNKKLLMSYECEKAHANQANAALVGMANKLTVAETKQKECQRTEAALSDLFELAEKQRIQLNEKDKELQENKQANEELLANMDLEKIRAIEAATDNLNTELANAQQTILTFKMTIWKSLPSADLCYYIKVPAAGGGHAYLYSDNGYLCSGALDLSFLPTARFKFTKNSDGTFCIYKVTVANKECLQPATNSYESATAFTFTAYSSQSKFVLFYNHQKQNKQPGILVDIYSLANGYFLSVDNPQDQNRVLATSRTAPATKFLLVPVV